MSNQALEDYLAQFGIKTFRCDVGDKNVLESLYKEKINFGESRAGILLFQTLPKQGMR